MASWLFPTLRGYRAGWLGRDILAGTAAGAVIVPQAMAYATIANLPVEIGLYTCMMPALVYALIGGSRAMSVSTTSTIATLVATTFVSAGVAATAEDAVSSLITLTLLVGVILVLARLFHLGDLIENINEATLIGMKVGLGATVALGQVPKLLGVEVVPTGHGFIRSLVATIEAVPGANLPTVVLSVATIGLLVLLKAIAPAVPAQLIAVAGGIILVATTGLPGVAVIEPVPSGLPVPSLPPTGLVVELLPGAFAIAVMAFLETAAVARGIRLRGEPAIDSNRELLAAGLASVAGSFFHSLPAAGGFSQSAVNQRAGARSQLASVTSVVLAILVAVLLAPILDNLPQATLASMVVVAVVGLIDVRGLVRLSRVSRIEFWIAVVTALVGLAAGLLPAVAAGVLFTIGLVLRELNRPRFDTVRQGSVRWVRPRSSLYTANVLTTQRAIEAILDEDGPGVRTLRIDASRIEMTSLTVLDAFADWDRELAGRGIRLEVIALRGEALVLARKTDWWAELRDSGRVLSSPAAGDPHRRGRRKAGRQ